MKTKIQGTVTIEFITDKIGDVSEYKIKNSVSPDIDTAAIHLFKMLLWNSATSDGIPVIGKTDIDIKYNVKNYLKISRKRGYNHIQAPHDKIDTSYIIYNLSQIKTLPKPILPNGNKYLQSYIYSNLNYPDAASKLGLEGDVELMFIIETNGLTSNIETIKYLGGGCTEEAIRILETINWYPALIDDIAVRSKYNMKISFKKGDAKDSHIPNQSGSGI